jgi:prepilin peptidase CpaA
MLSLLLLVILVVIAAVTDAAQHRIYNWTTYPGIIGGVVLAGIAAALEWRAPETAAQWRQLISFASLGESLQGLAVCGIAMVLCFVFFPMGGGDVKLLAMIGAILGLEKGLEVLLWTFIFGGCLGLTIIVWRLGPLYLFKLVGYLFRRMLPLGAVTDPPPEEKKVLGWPLYLGPCSALAVMVALIPWHGLNS